VEGQILDLVHRLGQLILPFAQVLPNPVKLVPNRRKLGRRVSCRWIIRRWIV